MNAVQCDNCRTVLSSCAAEGLGTADYCPACGADLVAFRGPRSGCRIRIEPTDSGWTLHVNKPGRDAHSRAVTLIELERALMSGEALCVGPCKCVVELDGRCAHGYPTALRAMGYI